MSELPRYVIRRISIDHCARGPDRCPKCRAVHHQTLALLDTLPDEHPEAARPVIDVGSGEQRAWRVYDIVRLFDDAAEAAAYAREHGVEDVSLS